MKLIKLVILQLLLLLTAAHKLELRSFAPIGSSGQKNASVLAADKLVSKNSSEASPKNTQAQIILANIPSALPKSFINKLTQDQSNQRSNIVEDVDYDVVMAVPKGKTFFGKMMVTFKLKKLPDMNQPLFMDFYGRHIEDLQINGIKISQTP